MATTEQWQQAAYRVTLRPGAEPPAAPLLIESLCRLALTATVVFVALPFIVAAMSLIVFAVAAVVGALFTAPW